VANDGEDSHPKTEHMGKQITFFMNSDDEREFVEFVGQNPSTVFIQTHGDRQHFTEFRYPEEMNLSNYLSSFWWIWNKEICGKLTVRQFKPDAFALDTEETSGLVQFHRSFPRGKVLLAGRLWAEMYALDRANQQLVYRGKEFEKWYDKLARWIRNRYTRDPKYGDYIGSGARAAYERGDVDIAEHWTPNGPR